VLLRVNDNLNQIFGLPIDTIPMFVWVYILGASLSVYTERKQVNLLLAERSLCFVF
jgi:hypothetical protein